MIFLYEIFFSLSLGPFVWVYNADILPEKGLAIATFANWICCFVVSLVFPLLVDAWSMQALFFIYGGCCILGFVFIYFFVIETKGLTSG